MKRCFVSKGTLENREDNLAGINMDLTGVKRDLGSVTMDLVKGNIENYVFVTMDLVKGNIENYVFICFCIQLSLSFDKIGGVSAKKSSKLVSSAFNFPYLCRGLFKLNRA